MPRGQQQEHTDGEGGKRQFTNSSHRSPPPKRTDNQLSRGSYGAAFRWREEQEGKTFNTKSVVHSLFAHEAKMNGTYIDPPRAAQQKKPWKQWNALYGDQRTVRDSESDKPWRAQDRKKKSQHGDNFKDRESTHKDAQGQITQNGSKRDNRAPFTGPPRAAQQMNYQRSDRSSASNQPKHDNQKKEKALRGDVPIVSGVFSRPEKKMTQHSDKRRVRISSVVEYRSAEEATDQLGSQLSNSPSDESAAVDVSEQRNAQPVDEERQEDLIVMGGGALSLALERMVGQTRLDPEDWEQSPALLRIVEVANSCHKGPDDTDHAGPLDSMSVLSCELDENGQEVLYFEPIPELDESDEAIGVEAVAVPAEKAPVQPRNDYSAESLAEDLQANHLQSLLESGIVFPVVALAPGPAQVPVVPQAAAVPQHSLVLAALPAPVVVATYEDETSAVQPATDSGLGSCSDSIDCDGDKSDYQKLIEDENENQIEEPRAEQIAKNVEPTVIDVYEQSTDEKICRWQIGSEGYKVVYKGGEWHTVPSRHRNWRWIKNAQGNYSWEVGFFMD